jgi:hypothetical protein
MSAMVAPRNASNETNRCPADGFSAGFKITGSVESCAIEGRNFVHLS